MAAFPNTDATERISGTPASDTFLIAAGTSGGGNDRFSGRAGDDEAQGGTGNDALFGGLGRDRLFGGDGGDRLFGGYDADLLDGGAGDDVIRGGLGNDTIEGGTAGLDGNRLFGEDGDDRIGVSAGGAPSRLDGGAGNDVLNAFGGGHILIGGAGNDVLNIRPSGIVAGILAQGGAGNDTISATFQGSHILDGGRGQDLLFLVQSTASLRIDLALAEQRVSGDEGFGPFTMTLRGFESIVAGSGNDTLRGTNGANGLNGMDGDDVISGRRGNDDIFGGLGRDMLMGGPGRDRFEEVGLPQDDGGDIYHGGRGSDSFRFARTTNSPADNPDRIGDFQPRRDVIDLSRFAAADNTPVTLVWIGAGAFSGTGPEVRFAAERLEADADGDGTADFALRLPGVTALTPGPGGDLLL